MLSRVFDGRQFAQELLLNVQEQAQAWSQQHGDRLIRLHSIYPYQDPASVIYTQLKQRDADKNGLRYTTQALSLKEPISTWVRAVQEANLDETVQGVLVQKPSSQQFQSVTGGTQQDFDSWWGRVSETIAPHKDVDCLSPDRLGALERAAEQTTRRLRHAARNLDEYILPATALAVVLILERMAGRVEALRQKRVAVIGRSQIVGRPAAAALQILGVETELMSSQSDLRKVLPEFDGVVSATGRADLVAAEWVKGGVWLVDVGAPTAEFQADARGKAEWWTPVPGGVGPVTRACLLQNAVWLAASGVRGGR